MKKAVGRLARGGGYVVGELSESDIESAPLWAKFVADLRAAFVEIPPTATRDFDVSRHGILGHAQRLALRRLVDRSRGDLDPMALDAARTLGDLFDLCGGHLKVDSFVQGTFETDRVFLRPYAPSDLDACYASSLDPASNFRWRFRGTTPSPDQFNASMFAGVVAQYIVCPTGSSRPIGLVSAYNQAPDGGTCFIAVQRLGRPSDGEVFEGLALFIDYLFVNFNYRKLYAVVPGYNENLIAGLDGGLTVEEGRLRDHGWFNGRLWDEVTIAIYRNTWETFAQRWFNRSILP